MKELYLYADQSNPRLFDSPTAKLYYFSDGANCFSENMNYKNAKKQEKFLTNLGIKVVDRT